MTLRHHRSTTEYFVCPICAYDHMPEEAFDEFYCTDCGPMGGVANKCVKVQRCDDCDEDDDACECPPHHSQ